MRTAVVNIGTIVSGDWRDPIVPGDTVVVADGIIKSVGTASPEAVAGCDVVIDAGGATAVPGLIDSHVHITFGDYTPRQKTVGFLESYLHGGVTTAITASEVHVPGRPRDPAGVKALAIAAQRCFAEYRPGGMRVWAGSVILEPGLAEQDFKDLAAEGVWLAKAGFGAFADPEEYAPLVAMARRHGMVTTLHTGGASIPGSSPITGDHVLAIDPDVSFHVNGGPVAMADEHFERVIAESKVALQICTAGNLRTAMLCARLAIEREQFHRVLIATDTPTGSGIMPLGMIYTITHLASLLDLPPEMVMGAATGNNAAVYGRNSGLLAPGRDGDLVVIDAPLGGARKTALGALANGDPVAVGAVISDGVPRFVGRSRNTPPTTRPVRVAQCTLPREFA
ncbi:amidohydrolase family protein [Roseitranquillus sediminis]|uniref:amidohydrolase family protein n=1 Tax=Roseitranquillus sediminis TaxID=2809051 RepID=UPI001D0C7791|nr:amidohydrolase family protein [Roseitranquillus sediminis]MBM9594455.1 amidohydrolase family protein [Roseitranquillus sediminis]